MQWRSFNKGKYSLLLVLILAITVMGSACGAANEVSKEITKNGVTFKITVSPYPIAAMQNEHILVSVKQNGHPAPIQKITANVSMKDMNMKDNLTLTKASEGVFQSDYQFSMSGNWYVDVHAVSSGHEIDLELPVKVSH
jgi:hypothetical protein